MDIQLADQRIFALNENFSLEQIRQRAMDRRTNAVAGGLGGLIQRPKSEEVLLVDSQKRFEPFWHVACLARYVYDRSRKYNVAVSGPEVHEITLHGEKYPVADLGKGGCVVTLRVTEHCREESRQELFADAQTSTPLTDVAPLVRGAKIEINDPHMLAAEGAIIVPPETRASFVVRQLLNQMLKPVQADAVHEESLILEATDLYYRPVWAFEFHWKPKDKRGVVEFDGVTGQMRTSQSLMPRLTKMISRDALFDLGADTVGMLIPGGNLAVKIAKVALDSKKQ
ncbi:MAG TPA: hypothetical protein VJG32_03500 [Anaerolineae bacterium]|nr:hypothetical protein [Anaerolineae bacterium]